MFPLFSQGRSKNHWKVARDPTQALILKGRRGALSKEDPTVASARGRRRGPWLPYKDSNLDKQIQNLLCYRYTIRQSGGMGDRSHSAAEELQETASLSGLQPISPPKGRRCGAVRNAEILVNRPRSLLGWDSMNSPTSVTFSLVALLLVPGLRAGDWPGWRGPAGDGTLPASETYPVTWSAGDAVWRVELGAPGNSSPVVVGNRLFLTEAREKGHERSLVCFDTATGKERWRQTVKYGKDEITHATNPWCSASPLVHEGMVYAWHGSAGLHAYDLDGRAGWQADLGEFAHIWGPNAASPVVWGDLIIVHAGPGLLAKLVALNRKTGKLVWETALPDAQSAEIKQFKGSWAVPRILDNGGRAEMLVPLPKWLVSFDPATGKEWWRCGGLSDLCYNNPLVGDGTVVAMCGYGGPAIGVRLPGAGETGDLTASHRLWLVPRNQQRIGSGILLGGNVYICNEPGAAQCFDAKTGEEHWKERLGKNAWSSLNYVGGKCYVVDQTAETHVFEPSPSGLKVVAHNVLTPGEATNATPAFAGGAIYLRTNKALYRIGK